MSRYVALLLALLLPLLAACGGPQSNGGRTTVVASFYPLQYLVERLGRGHVDVVTLTRPGQEPHELELAPSDLGQLSRAALVVYQQGLQPAVDEAVGSAGPRARLDVAPVADLTTPHDEPLDGGDDHDHDHAGPDPHFWLDPIRYAKVAAAVAGALSEADPAHRGDYDAALRDLQAELTALDAELRAGLARCARTDVVTGHAAFGYLTHGYGLRQVAIAGLSPEQEPEPRRLAEIAAFVRDRGVSTLYTETLASPAVARTIAAETGATLAVLDPIEGITDASAARDYPGLMRANLAALRQGQGCS